MSHDCAAITLERFKSYAQVVNQSTFCHATPLLCGTERVFGSELPDNIGSLSFKVESAQNGGCFKIRGAACQLGEMIENKASDGKLSLVAYSGGNYGKAFAMVCDHFGVPATVVMPKTVAAQRKNVIRGFNAAIRLGDGPELLSIVKEEVEKGKKLAHPFDDLPLIGGYGSITFEIQAHLKEPDVILVPVGGGGLLSGIAACARLSDYWEYEKVDPIEIEAEMRERQDIMYREIVKAYTLGWTNCKIYGVEPETSNVMHRCFKANRRVDLPGAKSIAVGTCSPEGGRNTYPICRRYTDGILIVSDDQILHALKTAYKKLSLLLEPTGVVALAAVLAKKLDFLGSSNPSTKLNVLVIISGSNISIEDFLTLVQQ